MFHIIDDWYLVADEYSWMVARKVGTTKTKGFEYPKFRDAIYHKKPEDALKSFCVIYARNSAKQRAEGTILDLVNILSSEYEKLEEHVCAVLREIYKDK